jgi:Zn finger protein HypA/HybF involved in hydrogenase expression
LLEGLTKVNKYDILFLERSKSMLACEDCGNDDVQRMCMGICAVCGGEIIEVDEDGERVDEDA